MNTPSAVSASDIPAANSVGSARIASTGGQREQPDLAGRVEPEPEQDAERVEVPAARDQPERLADEQPVHEAPVEHPPLELRLVELAVAHRAGDADDVDEHDEIEPADDEQERARYAGADHAADLGKAGEVGLDRGGRDGEPDRQRKDDRRVAEREEEPHAQRALALLAKLARGVVDRGDVVRVEGVPQAEGVGQRAEPDQHGLTGREDQEQAPADDVQPDDGAAEAGQSSPFGGRERSPHAGHLGSFFVSVTHADHATWGSALAVMTTPMATIARLDRAGSAAATRPGTRNLALSRWA